MTTASQISPTGISYIDSILQGAKWDGAVLTYAFPTAASQYLDQDGAYDSSGDETSHWGRSFSAAEQQAVRDILESISQFTNLTFVEVTDPGNADLRFGWTDAGYAPETTAAWTYAPGNADASGDVWLNGTYGAAWTTEDFQPGNAAHLSLMHEIGHALGLKEPAEASGQFPAAKVGNNRLWDTVMAYPDGVLPGASANSGYPFGYQRDDIAALQALYGVNTTSRGENWTSYVVTPQGECWHTNSNPANILKQASNPVFYLTLWDGGGRDSLTLNQLSEDQWIDLRPGNGSVFLHNQQLQLNERLWAANIYNAHDPQGVVEDVNLGAGKNIVVGSAVDNAIYGYDGHDIFISESYLSENYSTSNQMRASTYSNTGSYTLLIPQNGTLSYTDPEGDMYRWQVDIRGPQGHDQPMCIEEIWFLDKKVIFNFTPQQLTITVEDHILSSKFAKDWWAYHAPGSTTDDVITWLETPEITVSRIPPTGIPYIDSLLMGSKWDGTVLTYAFPTVASQYLSDDGTYQSPLREDAHWGRSFNALEQQTVRDILNSISQFTILTFVEATDPSEAVLRFAFAAADDEYRPGTTTAWAYHPWDSNSGGDVWINGLVTWAAKDFQPGQRAHSALMHEIGHALGLKHPFEAAGQFPVAPANENYYWNTVMAYAGMAYLTGPPHRSYYPFGYQRNDIAALQTLYGVNTTIRGENWTTYTVSPQGELHFFNADTGQKEVLKQTANPVCYLTLWDGGGRDRFSLDQLSEDQWIDLRPGKGSVFLHGQQLQLLNTLWTANIYNAHDPQGVVEDVNLGAGKNIVMGSVVDNSIYGHNGYDIFISESYLSENYSMPNQIRASTYSNTGSHTLLIPQNGTLSYTDPEGDMFRWQVDIRGPQGHDQLTSVEEIWFLDKKISFDITPSQLTITIEDHTLSSKFAEDWWGAAAPGSTTDDLIAWLEPPVPAAQAPAQYSAAVEGESNPGGQVTQLVQAMACFPTSTVGFDTAAVSQLPVDAGLQGATLVTGHA
jgi:serralysin